MDSLRQADQITRFSHAVGKTPCITYCGVRLAMPSGTGLIITRHRGPYWFFHLPRALVTHRRIDRLGDWIVSTPVWHAEAMRPAWGAMREGLQLYLDWCDSSGLSPDVFLARHEVHVDWPSPQRRCVSGWRWETVPPFEEFERRTSEMVDRLAATARARPDVDRQKNE